MKKSIITLSAFLLMISASAFAQDNVKKQDNPVTPAQAKPKEVKSTDQQKVSTGSNQTTPAPAGGTRMAISSKGAPSSAGAKPKTSGSAKTAQPNTVTAQPNPNPNTNPDGTPKTN